MMYTKGADSIVLRRLEKNNAMSNVVKNTKKHITEYSIKGFRTLVIARKELSKTDLDNFAMAYDTASKAIDKREELVRLGVFTRLTSVRWIRSWKGSKLISSFKVVRLLKISYKITWPGLLTTLLSQVSFYIGVYSHQVKEFAFG